MNKKRSYNMKSKLLKFFLALFLGFAFSVESTFAEGGDGGQKGNNTLNKPLGAPIRAYMNINFISTLIKNDGISDINAGQDASGLIYPKGSGKTAVYTSGFLWAAKVNDPTENDPHVGGTVYRTGLQGGWIDASGTVYTESDPRARIYRVRPDVYLGGPNIDLSVEAQDEVKSESDVRAQYELDWTQWPADLGAPYFDGNGNGVYDPTPNPVDSLRDIPGVPGASQTIWYVTNDQSSERTNFMYGTDPMGIEMQATFWAYAQTGALGNMFFRRYLIINKTDVLGSNRTFDSMYVSMWSDPDNGDSGDDYAGCDTVLSVSYCYNGKGIDAVYGDVPPAIGFDFFQGPLVDGVAGEDINKNGIDDAADFAIFKNKKVGPGKINLPMTAAYYYINSDPTLTDPTQGSYAEGAVRWYRFFQGRIGLTNEPFIDPNTGLESKFTLPGDPVTRTGWIDGQQFGYGDRRIGMASGPFNMAPGDTQEVVVAEIVAGAVTGVDRLSAISLMKYYDQIAQVAYDSFFDLPTPPPPPFVDLKELDGEIVLDWSKDNEKVLATENFNSKGYTFQGYNVYQLPTASSAPSEGVRVATYDIIDGIGKITDLVFDPTTGSVVVLPVQFGTDFGVKRFISIKQDAINQRPLINGIRYYFAVTAYNFNPDLLAVPNNLENPLQIITVIPHSNDPGVTYGEGNGTEFTVGNGIDHSGTADGGPTVTIVDPTVTTGHKYEVYFTDRQEIRDPNGDWIPASTVRRHFNPNDPDTLTGSSIQIAGVYGPQTGTLQLNFVLDLVSVDFDYADGISLTFPAGVTVLDAPAFEGGNGHVSIEIISYGDSTVVNLGDVSHPYTGNGPFAGGEEWSILVSAELPLTTKWIIYDDGFGGGPVDAFGETTVESVSNLSRLARYWNVRDLQGGTVLENQSVIAGTDIYPRRDDIITNLGLDASPIVDGFQTSVDVVYDAPINFFRIALVSPTGLSTLSSPASPAGSTTDIVLNNYTIFGGTTDSWAISNFGVGTTSIDTLQQDYELRFTGVLDTNVVGGQTQITVKSGGSMATIFRFGGGLAGHPLNPTGENLPFLIRIPFEVWNVNDPENPYQVNLTFRDRVQTPTDEPFYCWNLVNRMYAIIVNSPYDSTQVIQVDDGPDEFNAAATWVLVFYGTNYHANDVVTIIYANPIQIGIDTYTFNTTASAYSGDLAKDQVNQINVFPNPYYGINTEEINKYNRFVTITHLPVQAKVRIFNLAGVLVRTIEKTDQGQFLRWDLANEDGLPVASGVYIAYIDLPELGTTKILKLAIIQEQQILDRF
jgi:hypothetical protein